MPTPPIIKEALQVGAKEIGSSQAQYLLAHITQQNRIALITHDQTELTDHQWALFQQALQRMSLGEPLAYIVGMKEFYSRRFKVNPHVLIPRADTEILVDVILEKFSSRHVLNVLDLGTGSGVIGITLAKERPSWKLIATDVSNDALSVAKFNCEALDAQVELLSGSWFEPIQGLKNQDGEALKFDLICSNPPYIPQNDPHLQDIALQFEPQIALTDYADGMLHFRKIAADAQRFLKPKGMLVFEHGYDQARSIRNMLADYGFVEIKTHKDLADHERVTWATFEF